MWRQARRITLNDIIYINIMKNKNLIVCLFVMDKLKNYCTDFKNTFGCILTGGGGGEPVCNYYINTNTKNLFILHTSYAPRFHTR